MKRVKKNSLVEIPLTKLVVVRQLGCWDGEGTLNVLCVEKRKETIFINPEDISNIEKFDFPKAWNASLFRRIPSNTCFLTGPDNAVRELTKKHQPIKPYTAVRLTMKGGKIFEVDEKALSILGLK